MNVNVYSPEKMKVLKNIHDRLQLCYGSDYGITISSEKNVGTTVYVRLADQIQSDHKS